MAGTGYFGLYYITEAGRNMRQSVIANGKAMVFTRAAIGDGKPVDAMAVDGMTGLVSYIKDVIIKKSYTLDANHLHVVRVDNERYPKDVMMTEMAVFAKYSDQEDDREIMYGYAYISSGYILIPAQTGETNRIIFEITLDSHLSRASDVQVIYDSSGLFASHADLDDFRESIKIQLDDAFLVHDNDLNAHPVILAEIGSQISSGIQDHDTSDISHGDIRAKIAGHESRIKNLETVVGGGISTNPFSVTFGSLTGVSVTGTWNRSQGRIEF